MSHRPAACAAEAGFQIWRRMVGSEGIEPPTLSV